MDTSFIYHTAYVQDRRTIRTIAQVSGLADKAPNHGYTLKCVHTEEAGWAWFAYNANTFLIKMTTLETNGFFEIVCITAEGDVQVGTIEGMTVEVIDDSPDGPSRRGPMRDLQLIGGYPYAVGMSRQVYRRDGPGTWSRQDEGVVAERGVMSLSGFNSVDGRSEDDIFAVGFNGEVWRRLDGTWNQEPQIVSCVLTKVLVISDDLIYACGQQGTLLRSDGDSWRKVEQAVTDKDFWGMAWFDGALFVSTDSAVFRLNEKNEINEVDMGRSTKPSCRHLHSHDGVLMSVGAKDIMVTADGHRWLRFDPDNARNQPE
ncbi:TPA: hypothetical protein L4R50_000103 [Pseudomonas aeruginosa]|nr:hypothetical protein [Pseudomonas aeruginosa]